MKTSATAPPGVLRGIEIPLSRFKEGVLRGREIESLPLSVSFGYFSARAEK